MSDRNLTSPSFRSSFLVALISTGLIVALMGCSDMTSDGLTRTEFQQAQTELSTQQDNAPLYVVNGEPIKDNNNEANVKFGRIKSKYVQSVDVLKNQSATNKYGKAGTNGVIELQLASGIDRETLFSDLKDAPPSAPVDNAKNNISSQSSDAPPAPVYMAVEKMPELQGGLAGLQKKISYPQKAKNKGIEGSVTLQFVVNKNGQVENPEILRGIGGGCDKEALRVVKQAQFKPGKNKGGTPVRVQYSLPVRFQL